MQRTPDVRRSISAFYRAGSRLDDICHVANAVREGLVVLPLTLLSRIESFQIDDSAESDQWQRLTEREIDVLTLLAKGASNKVIAHRLAISDSTVRVHVRSILAKLQLKNRTEAALMAVKNSSLQSRQVERKAEISSSAFWRKWIPNHNTLNPGIKVEH